MSERRERATLPMRTPRTWHGMTARVWWRLLASQRFAVSPSRVPMACAITAFTLLNSFGRRLENLAFGRRADLYDLRHPPLFIIGHWRTGTTLLHELLVLDQRFSYPTTYQCMAPHHFLHTQGYVTRLFGFVLPAHRPMDDMAVGWDRPQEDEFALCNLGVPSPYLQWAFPDRPCPWDHYLDLEGLTPAELQEWEQALLRFLKRLQWSDPRRVVLKSPTHTARIGVLRRLFPQAQFLHIVRHPYEVVPSTIRTFQRMGDVLGLRTGSRADWQEYAFQMYERMYRRFHDEVALLEQGQFCEVRYEQLIAQPTSVLQSVYQQLGLGDFEPVRGAVESYFRQRSDYRRNQLELPEPLRREIDCRWADYLTRYGYHTGG